VNTPRNAAVGPRHTPAIEEVYRRMLGDAGAQGRFVPRPSGRLVHLVAAGDGPPVVHLHGTNTSALSHLMFLVRTPGTRSYLVDRPGCGLSDPDSFLPGHFREHAVSFVGDVLDALDLDTALLGRRHLGHLVRPGPPGAGPRARHAGLRADPARWPGTSPAAAGWDSRGR